MKILKQIYSSAPVRVCDIGGWTDTWFAQHGAVFNIAVSPNVEVKITVSRRNTDERVTLHLRNFNETYSLDPDKIVYNRHPLIEAAIDSMEIPQNLSLEIDIFSAVPSGASVGTSAAVCTALIAALDALTEGRMTPHETAVLAHKVETEKLGLQSGVQDQLCSVYGGINYIEIHSFPHATIHPVKVPVEFRSDLENRLALIYIGTPHNSSDIHKMVIADLGGNAESDARLERLRQLAAEARDAAAAGDLTALGKVMNQNTDVQRALHPGLVCRRFEEIIKIARSFGVSGCKVNGAGGDGGSVTILTDGDNEKKKELLHMLEMKGYRSLPVSLSPCGVLAIGDDPCMD